MTFEILFTIFHNFLTKYNIEQLRSSSQQSQFLRVFKYQNVDINHKSHQCVNKNIFSFNIALIMNLLRNGLWAGWESILRYWSRRLQLTGWMYRDSGCPGLKNVIPRHLSRNYASLALANYASLAKLRLSPWTDSRAVCDICKTKSTHLYCTKIYADAIFWHFKKFVCNVLNHKITNNSLR